MIKGWDRKRMSKDRQIDRFRFIATWKIHYKGTNISLRTYKHIVNLTSAKGQRIVRSTVFIQNLIVYYDFLAFILSIKKKFLGIKETKKKEMKVKNNRPKHIHILYHPSRSCMGGR